MLLTYTGSYWHTTTIYDELNVNTPILSNCRPVMSTGVNDDCAMLDSAISVLVDSLTSSDQVQWRRELLNHENV